MQAAGRTSRVVPREDLGNEEANASDRKQCKSSVSDRRDAPVSDEAAEIGRGHKGSQRPEVDHIQAALIAALQSREFQSAPQLRAFLGFVVRATLDHEQEKLKGYTIAVEALGRPEDFNPVTDPIVRVEAARLRRRLEKYYSGTGLDDPVRIVIPKGSYTPEFHSAHTLATIEKPATGVLAFQESETDFNPAPTDASSNQGQVRHGSRHIASDPRSRTASGSEPVASQTASSTGSQHVNLAAAPSGAADRLIQLRVPLTLTLAFGAACFLAGYLLAFL